VSQKDTLFFADKKEESRTTIPTIVMTLPPSFEELIKGNHPVRLINQIINSIDIAGCWRNAKEAVLHFQLPTPDTPKVLIYAEIALSNSQ
jgi:hypothetical protein